MNAWQPLCRSDIDPTFLKADTNGGGGGGGDIFSADESQDEIAVSPSPKKVSSASSTKSPKKVSGKSVDLNLTAGGGVANDSLILGDFDVSQLTDDQLAEALVERKIAVGPIVGKCVSHRSQTRIDFNKGKIHLVHAVKNRSY